MLMCTFSAVFVSAACCTAPSMTCEVHMSQPSTAKLGDEATVTCDVGQTLLGCSVYSEDGNTVGVRPIGKNHL